MFQKSPLHCGEFRLNADALVVDFHDGRNYPSAYYEHVADWENRVLNGLKEAQTTGRSQVYFTHGSSTSHNGATTARSVVRGLMRSKVTTPYVVKKD